MKKTIFTLGLAFFLITAFTASASACDRGCTPGYWKQPQHWWPQNEPPNYSREDSFYETFKQCDDALAGDDDISLLTALQTGGGGLAALRRHAVASLLNADRFSCFDGGSPADVIDAYCDHLADADAIEYQKDLFEGDNDQNCNLGGSGRGNAYGQDR